MAPRKKFESKPLKTRKNAKFEAGPNVPKSRSRKKESKPQENSSSTKKTNAVAAEVSEKTFEPIPPTSKMSTPVARTARKSRIPRMTKIDTTVPPATSSSAEEGGEEGERKKNQPYISPSMYNYYLNAYKLSPDYENLKCKRFNTSFIHRTPERDRHIEIFTPQEEEEISRRLSESLPVVKNKINVKVPGEKYKNVFCAWKGLSSAFSSSSYSSSEEDKQKSELKKLKKKRVVIPKRKRGRPKAVGYKGVPLPDDKLLTDISRSLHEDGEIDSSSDEDCVITKDNSILHSLLPAPPNKKAVKQYQPKSCAASSSKNTEIKKRKYIRKKN